jgi:hypothetical protein
VAVRDDLAGDLRRWLDDKLAATQAKARESGQPIPLRLSGDTSLFVVPAGLVRILDRDLRAAGIPKRDDRGRTVDVHAMRTTFGTLLSTTGTAPRTAQAAMRHSDIKLTMGVYTDPRLLDVRGAVERLPALPLNGPPLGTEAGAGRRTGTDGGVSSVTPGVTPTPGRGGRSGSSAVTEGSPDPKSNRVAEGVGIACPVNENAPLTSPDISGAGVGLTGFEPATSWSRRKGFGTSVLRKSQRNQRITPSTVYTDRMVSPGW